MKRTSASAAAHHLTFEGAVGYGLTKTFRVFAYVHLAGERKQATIVARDGTSYEVVGPSHLFPRRKKPMDIPIDGGKLDFLSLGIASAVAVGQAPPKVMDEMWG